MTVTGADVLRQLARAGVLAHTHRFETETKSVRGTCEVTALLDVLRAHPSFQEGWAHGLHPDIGHDRCDFRSYRNSFGPGSLQLVIGRDTGIWYADIDAASPYEDVVSFVWHTGEVLGHHVRRWFRRTP